jgi:hypothetical protein
MTVKRYIPFLLALVVLLSCLSASPAFAEGAGCPEGSTYTSCAPGWEVNSHTLPTNLAPGESGLIQIDIHNIGARASEGKITVTDTLPAGVTFNGRERSPALFYTSPLPGEEEWICTGSTTVTCTNSVLSIPVEDGERGLVNFELGVTVAAGSSAEGTFPNVVTVSGGGASSAANASASDEVTISSTPASFGFSSLDSWASNANGTIDTQAGSHPYDLGVSFVRNTACATAECERNAPAGAAEDLITPGGELRNLEVSVPPGFIGDPTAAPQCPRLQFDNEECPPDTQIGIDVTTLGKEVSVYANIPLFNLVPPANEPAQFGFTLFGNPVFLDAVVRSGGDYGITEHVYHLPERDIVKNETVLWGVPSDPSHDAQRCKEASKGCGQSSSAPPVPFFTLPTSCEGPQVFSQTGNSWSSPLITGEIALESHNGSGVPTGYTGCNYLGFEPAISIAPDTTEADTPAGLTAEVKVPQTGLLQAGALATSNIKDTKVTLPEGIVINPGQATGLQACQMAESGVDAGEALGDEGPASCPAASKVGTVEIESPLVPEKFVGDVYVLQSEPPDLKLLLAASADGVNLKIVGEVHLNEATGRLVTTFDGNGEDQGDPAKEGTPELPFTNFRLSFNSGAQAALDTPTLCGDYDTNTDFAPWSTPFVPDVLASNEFAIDSASGGGACPSSPLPFHPQLIAGATTDQAGGYTDFSLLLQRGDDQQRIDGLQFKAPEGLTGLLAKVPLCTNAQAEANVCPESSKIGHTVVESGPGPYPLVVPEPGQPPAPIYLTESYDSAPFGLSIVVPLHVGPFTLPTQRVRAKIEVNSTTSALTVTTNPLPQEVAGVPTDLREIDSVIERPEFMINPTNCDPQEFSGAAYGTPPPGQSEPSETASIGSHFQVGSCRSLQFHPQLGVSTSSKSSRANGTSVSFKLSYPKEAIGKESWLKRLKVDLPKQLPARLSTLQKSCPAVTFNANPAACPAASRIGTARVRTQLLPVPLEGPVYFVSNGGAKFPEAVFALQGDGVTIDIHAETLINEKTGVTSATFNAIPDDPFEEATVTLPSGPYSEFTAIGNLCAATRTVVVKEKVKVRSKGHTHTVTRKVKKTVAASLEMPTAFVGQNGAEIHQNTPITVTGCGAKAKKAKAKAKSKKKR